MKLVVDRTRCVGNGFCEEIAPDVFQVGDDGKLVVHNETVGDLGLMTEAVDACPAKALSIAPPEGYADEL